jgi:endoglucanase
LRDRSVVLILCFLVIFGAFSIAQSNTSQSNPTTAQASSFAPIDPAVQVKQMQRGVNIIGYDPLWQSFDRRRFKQEYFQQLLDAGFRTVRVNLHAFRHMDSMNRMDPTWFKTLDWVVDNATSAGLTVILDEHDYNACGDDAALCRTKLIAFWEQVAPRYKKASNAVIFEILNEPNKALTSSGWNALLHDALAIIRTSNPDRNVVIGPAWWNSIKQLDTLELPSTDRHIIVTVHYYSPMEFTHQGAKWNKETAQLSGIKWGTPAEQQSVAKDFDAVQHWSEASGRPILLGEFGAYDKGDMDSRARYTSFVARTAESHGWAWTYWQFDSDFVLYDVTRDKWIEPIRDALIPKGQ